MTRPPRSKNPGWEIEVVEKAADGRRRMDRVAAIEVVVVVRVVVGGE
jgi:hypothetical protein